MNYIVSKNTISNISVFLAVLIAIISAQPWFTWHGRVLSLSIYALFLCTRVILLKNKIPAILLPTVGSCLIMYIYLFWFHATAIDELFTTLFTKLLPLLFVILFTNSEKSKFVSYLTDTMSIILVISLVFFLLWALGFSLPSSQIAHSAAFYSKPFTNYYAFVIIDNPEYNIFTRFQSIFTEPGHLGMVTALLLYANHYNLKKISVWILLISLLWSLSLAAYVLLFAGIIIYHLGSVADYRKHALKLIIFVVAVVAIGTVIYKVNEDSVISKLIISRLEYDKNGGLSGNNRNTVAFIKLYHNFVHSSDVLLGLGLKRFAEIDISGGNSSYKCFIMQYGIVGIMLLLGFAISAVHSRSSRLYWGFLILYALSFIQRPYFLWEIESFLFISFFGLEYNNKMLCTNGEDDGSTIYI